MLSLSLHYDHFYMKGSGADQHQLNRLLSVISRLTL